MSNLTEMTTVINATAGSVNETALYTVTPTSSSVSLDADAGGSLADLQAAKDVLFTIQYILLPFFLLTGLIGNTMTIVIMASQRFSHMTSRYILIFLALSDTVLLLTQPFNKLWIIKLLGKDLRAISETSCKAFFVIFKSAKMTSSWLVVLLCFERFVAVVFPLKAKMILRKRFIFPAIFLDYFFMFVYNSVWSFSSQVVGNVCKPDVPSEMHKNFVIWGCIFYSFLPTTLLMIFTPQIIIRLIRQRSLRRAMSSKSSSVNRKEVEMLRASVMVLGVMIAYIILIIPITIVHLYAFFRGVSAFDMTSIGFFVYREIAQILEQINYAVNFFFYVMCSAIFRRRVKEVLCLTSCGTNEDKDTNQITKKQSIRGGPSSSM